jgi:hypothetical protein
MAQMVEHKYEALSLKPQYHQETKNKSKNQKTYLN